MVSLELVAQEEKRQLTEQSRKAYMPETGYKPVMRMVQVHVVGRDVLG